MSNRSNPPRDSADLGNSPQMPAKSSRTAAQIAADLERWINGREGYEAAVIYRALIQEAMRELRAKPARVPGTRLIPSEDINNAARDYATELNRHFTGHDTLTSQVWSSAVSDFCQGAVWAIGILSIQLEPAGLK